MRRTPTSPLIALLGLALSAAFGSALAAEDENGGAAAPGVVNLSEMHDSSPDDGLSLFHGSDSEELDPFQETLEEPDVDPRNLAVADRFPLAKKSPQLLGLAARFNLVGMEEADLDGDGLREYVVALAPGKPDRQSGGFAVIAFRDGKFKMAWEGLYERSAPESLSVERGQIRARVRTPRGVMRVVLENGKDFQLHTRPLEGVTLKVSSRARGSLEKELLPEHLIDGDYDTVWCTSTVGTGVGEWVQLEFAKPIDLGLVGILGGDFRSQSQWKGTNRVFRYEMVAETKEDRTTLVEEMDLTKMLKLPTMGKRVAASTKDAMRTSWAEIAQRGVVGLKIEVASVYLGQNDSLSISDIDLGTLLPEPERSAPEPQVAEPASGSNGPAASPAGLEMPAPSAPTKQ
jgi:hypothetical protein